ncbi:hypothetical protein ACFSC6_00520 [Rufibacter sediminis]|uniref:SPOR domain-containing protein n=1 Tax=Rufibacter sediminis TaxID=2762756 RepID=A0ABR6VMQ8_9BACT|nr:hypothetical protein [Rufibacter sediminis]MBC3538164.1 hypothetical protein [Rufibacter sediminis]
MNKLSSLLSLSFATFFLFSCEKEEIEPNINAEVVSESRGTYCNEYSYFNKVSGPVSFGSARGGVLLVGFQEGLSMEARHQILSRYSQFKSIDGEIFMDSGVITRVNLTPWSTCSDVERLMERLKREGAVSFAYPFFEPQTTDPTEAWVGSSNEFMVSIEGNGTYEQLEQLMARTNTKLVFSFSDDIHLLRADKFSTGNVLTICSIFNQQSFITVAEPNLVYHIPDGTTPVSEVPVGTSKTRGKGMFKRFKK